MNEEESIATPRVRLRLMLNIFETVPVTYRNKKTEWNLNKWTHDMHKK